MEETPLQATFLKRYFNIRRQQFRPVIFYSLVVVVLQIQQTTTSRSNTYSFIYGSMSLFWLL